MRRYEILLPLRFNSGQLVPEELRVNALEALTSKFGAASFETQTVKGSWRFEGEIYEDDLVRFFVDVQDTPETHTWFKEFKERLKADFQQLDIWVTSHPIDVL
jgi:hypothetical protein